MKTHKRPSSSPEGERDSGVNQFTGRARKSAKAHSPGRQVRHATRSLYGDAPTTIMGRRLIQVQKVLDEVLTWEFAADSVVSHWLRAHPELGARDRSEVVEAVFDVLRHLRKYRQLAEGGVGPA